MHRTFSHRLPITLAVLVFVPVSCFEKDCGPNELECVDDKACPSGSVCREDTDGCGDSGRRCVSVTECTSNADCLTGQPCVRREAEPAEHPFERSIEEHGVCGCGEDESCEPFVGTTAATGAGGDATGGGSPSGSGGFSPATSVTVGPTTGSGGATSSSSSGDGGAGGATSSASGGASSTSGAGGAGGTP